jgi:hypothetical protein
MQQTKECMIFSNVRLSSCLEHTGVSLRIGLVWVEQRTIREPEVNNPFSSPPKLAFYWNSIECMHRLDLVSCIAVEFARQYEKREKSGCVVLSLSRLPLQFP